MIQPDIHRLLKALEERPRCESDAFAIWLGLNPREENPWNLGTAMERFHQFQAAVREAWIRVTGRSLEGYTYHAPAPIAASGKRP
jgi:hypothetical protein